MTVILLISQENHLYVLMLFQIHMDINGIGY